ncbi:unnamed protein product [Mytilus edulis]|uniref:Uncharacterized protein n=1 Tax=Mytilus edulis TaxID=6550 RepID=A0A8S3TSU2_MYTED|nr:unnamed protein product [Mytilus edulis]
MMEIKTKTLKPKGILIGSVSKQEEDLVMNTGQMEKSTKSPGIAYPGNFLCDGMFVDCIVDSRLEYSLSGEKHIITDAFQRLLNKHLKIKKISRNYESLHGWFLESIKRIDIATLQINGEIACRYLLSHFDQNNAEYILSLHSDLKISIANQSYKCAKATAWKLTRLFVHKLPKKQVYDVWPGYICVCKGISKQDYQMCASDIVIVVEVFDIKDATFQRKFFYDIPIIYKEVNGHSVEAKLVSEKNDQFQRAGNDLLTVKISNEQAQKLFTAHRKLCLISKSLVRSKNFCDSKSTFDNEVCIQLFCRAKGIIPIGEEHFPISIKAIATDVFEGYPKLLVKSVKIGSEVGVSCHSGTLGGFLQHRGEDVILTCAHVVLGRAQLGPNADLSEINKNPILVNCKNPRERPFTCGNLVDYAFPPALFEGCSVDAAIIRKHSSTTICQNVVATDSDGHDLKSMYLNYNYVDYREIGTSSELKVIAVGAVSPVQQLREKICLVDTKQIEYETLSQAANQRAVHYPIPQNINDCNHFVGCLLNDVGKEELINPRTVTFHQQIAMNNVTFSQGDSGMCIYVKWPGNEYRCLGMAIASHPNGGCLITPIRPILSAFKLI